MGLRESIQTILRAEASLTAIVPADRIWTRALLRPGEDPDNLGTEPTPEAFDDLPPRWLRTNIVVGSRIARNQDLNRLRPDNLTARWGVTLAYYVPPDSEDVLEEISWQVSVALGRASAVIDLPGGRKGRAVVEHDITASVPVPEFPGAGYVMLERIAIPTTWLAKEMG